MRLVLFVGVMLVVTLVALWFELTVNRVFDMPKAYALKLGASLLGLVWLGWALFGPGVSWRAPRAFSGPVLVFFLAGLLSVFFSIDPWMSLVGVYERQFGVQGLLACALLFFVTSTSLRGQRGAVLGFSLLLVLGGIVGVYAYLQSTGLDPFGFFKKPSTKVYATLGNATFAGNALALVFPVSSMLALALAGRALDAKRTSVDAARGERIAAMGFAFVGIAGLLLLPGLLAAEDPTLSQAGRQKFFLGGVFLATLVLAFLGAASSGGLASVQPESPGGRRLADAAGAGGLLAFVFWIGVGLLKTRTRGAWVGTGVAVTAGLLLLPLLFRDQPRLAKQIRWAGLALVASLLVGMGVFLKAAPEHLYARTIMSIPHAFDPSVKTYGRGQGTRRYLWTESPRVLTHHGETLARKDVDEAVQKTKSLDFPDPLPPAGNLLQRTAVYLTGVGFEAYRYAFMSHKSKRLEALDQMTNHDNPHNNYLYVLATTGVLGLLAYLWLLSRFLRVSWRNFRRDDVSWFHRAVAFGVLTSFLSYSVYSIAGFDSVICSVFLFYLLGVSAVFFNPNDDPPLDLATQVRRQIKDARSPGAAPSSALAPYGLRLAMFAVAGAMLLHTAFTVEKLRRAEKAFVGLDANSFEGKVESIKRALELNPRESYYWLTLGNTYASGARQLQEMVMRASAGGKAQDLSFARDKLQTYMNGAEDAYYEALDHSWAPENVYISLFQLYYSMNDADRAISALRLVLLHSPHLPPVRANLALLELEAKQDTKRALSDCEWVLEIDPNNAMALRTCGRAEFLLGKKGRARSYLLRAKKRSPNDPTIERYLNEVETSTRPGR